MKKTILGFAISAMFMAGAAHAETNPNDVSATLNITGTVVPDAQSSCTVKVDLDSLLLQSDVKNLPVQGNRGDTNAAVIHVSLESASGNKCIDDAASGKIAYKFVGTVDNADGNVIANTDTSAEAAKGVGVGVFDETYNPLVLNQGTILANSSPMGNIVLLEMVKLNGQEVVAGKLHSSMTIDIERL